MIEQTSNAHPDAALNTLRADIHSLSPIAARICCLLLHTLTLPDAWLSALLRDLDRRADGSPWPDFDSLVAELGYPGHWQRAASHGDALDARMWLAGVQALVARHAPKPPPLD